MAKQFDVFLCHNSEDKPDVRKIADELEKIGIKPWLDERELRPGLPWQRLLEQQIGQIRSAAVFVGKQGIGPWQKQELEAFLQEFVERGCPVIPVILRNAPQQPQLPRFLRGMTWVDFRKRQPDPWEQLIWGITGQQYQDETRDSNAPDSDMFTLQNKWWSVAPIAIVWMFVGFWAEYSNTVSSQEQMMLSLFIGAMGGFLSGVFVGLAWLGTELFNQLEQRFLYSSIGAVVGAIGWMIFTALNGRANLLVGAIFGVIVSGITWQLNQKRLKT